MKTKMIDLILSVLNPKLVTEIIVEVLYYLAKRTENKLDDQVVGSIAEKLNIEVTK